MKQNEKSSEISSKERIRRWLESHDEAYVYRAIEKYNGIDFLLKKINISIEYFASANSLEYKEYILLLSKLLYAKDSDLNEMQESINSKDKEIDSLKSKLSNLEYCINIKDTKINGLEADLSDVKYKLSSVDVELEELKEKQSSWNKGKKHIRGTKEFYRDVKIACSLVRNRDDDKRVCKNGEPFKDYREAVKFAKECPTIQNYASSNKVKVNRENLKSWLSVAIALENNEEPRISTGKYKANRGYKR